MSRDGKCKAIKTINGMVCEGVRNEKDHPSHQRIKVNQHSVRSLLGISRIQMVAAWVSSIKRIEKKRSVKERRYHQVVAYVCSVHSCVGGWIERERASSSSSRNGKKGGRGRKNKFSTMILLLVIDKGITMLLRGREGRRRLGVGAGPISSVPV